MPELSCGKELKLVDLGKMACRFNLDNSLAKRQ